jgi:tRNA A37 threonylcarbamoyltransferase TsaD
MATYGSFNTTTQPTAVGTTKTLVDVSFSKIMDEINLTWKKLNEKQNIIEQDIHHLERMFNVYSNNALFYQGKEALHQEKATNMQKILQLEEQIFLVKRNSTSLL